MSVRVAQTFRGQWTCFFATCYSVELELFDQYLFRRLGEPPLNATILCDFDTHARRIDKLDLAQPGQLQRANRDYLLRGVTAGSSFHPKTYFFGNAKEGVLLVGSGNLTLRGIEEGHEIFCQFDSSRDDELGSIRAWRDWMEQIVGRLADREVTRRWLDLKERTREWLPGTATGSGFVSNFERSFLDQIGERLTAPVSELHVLAPFYDRDAKALEALLQRLQPQTLHLYIGAGTSVDGAALTAVLERFGGKVKLIGFDGQPEGKQAIKEGKIYADPIQFPDRIGAETARAFIKYMNGEDVPKQILIPTALYRKADAAKDPSLQ